MEGCRIQYTRATLGGGPLQHRAVLRHVASEGTRSVRVGAEGRPPPEYTQHQLNCETVETASVAATSICLWMVHSTPCLKRVRQHSEVCHQLKVTWGCASPPHLVVAQRVVHWGGRALTLTRAACLVPHQTESSLQLTHLP